MRGPSLLLITSALVLLLAGCAAPADPASVPADTSSTVDASGGDAGLDQTAVGSIEGMVTDDELNAIPGADVSLLKTEIKATTDEAGKFSILNVPPGEYSLVAQKLGYESKGVKVLVEPGVPAVANVVLAAINTAEAFYVTDTYTTIFQCMLGSAAWVSSCSYPYTAVYLTAHDNGVNLSTAGLPPDVMSNAWRHPVTVEFGIQGIVSEMVWQANTAVSQQMQIVNCSLEYDAVQDSCIDTYETAAGPSPLNAIWKLPKGVLPKAAGEQYTYSSNVWLNWGEVGGDSMVGVALDQKVDLYNSMFYGAEPPEVFSIVPAA